jgi:hypothetical protein
MLPPLVRLLTCFRIDLAGVGVGGGVVPVGMSDPRKGASSGYRLAAGLGNARVRLAEYVDDVADTSEKTVTGGRGQDALIIDDASSACTATSWGVPESRGLME